MNVGMSSNGQHAMTPLRCFVLLYMLTKFPQSEYQESKCCWAQKFHSQDSGKLWLTIAVQKTLKGTLEDHAQVLYVDILNRLEQEEVVCGDKVVCINSICSFTFRLLCFLPIAISLYWHSSHDHTKFLMISQPQFNDLLISHPIEREDFNVDSECNALLKRDHFCTARW